MQWRVAEMFVVNMWLWPSCPGAHGDGKRTAAGLAVFYIYLELSLSGEEGVESRLKIRRQFGNLFASALRFPSFLPCSLQVIMAPYFLRNLLPKRETRQHARPLLTVLGELTLTQWALFFSG